ncbi:MAG: hypothetical protein H7255_11645 [Ramlibacter sp.]|nr:hypothetical protein [Ramlibacter sp.]
MRSTSDLIPAARDNGHAFQGSDGDSSFGALAGTTAGRFRRRHLLCETHDAALATSVQQLFDEFFELEWIFDHRHGAAPAVLAAVAGELLLRQGLHCETMQCKAEVRRSRKSFIFGLRDWAMPEQAPSHAALLVEGTHLIDFALGAIRRSFDREFPWGIVCPVNETHDHAVSLDVPGHGRIRWSSFASLDASQQTMKTQAAVRALLREYDSAMQAA